MIVLALSIHIGLKAQPLVAPLQAPKATALKIGFMRGDIFPGYFTVGMEHGLGRFNSFAIDLGIMPFNLYGRRLGSFFGLGAFTDLKHFVAFRGRPMQGLFVGGHLGFNTATQYYTQVHRRFSTAIWGQLGLVVGGQVLFAKKFTTGISIKGGYSKSMHYRFYRTDGTLAQTQAFPQPLSLFLAIHFGYQF